jgi:hypothetical protein
MALTQVTGPYPIFTDLDGTPLDDGYLYIGAINDDPETNPIQVFWDANLTIPATQPIRTNNGYAYRNGTPALLYTGGEFSITIRNKRNEFVLYSPVGYGFDPAAVSASVVKNDFVGDGVTVAFVLSASPSTILATNIFINGVYQEKDSYTLSGNTITFSIAPPLSSSIEIMTNETGVINSGNATAISYTYPAVGAVGQTVQTRLEQYVSVKDFGAVGDGVTDDTAAIQAAIAADEGELHFNDGIYAIAIGTIDVENNSLTGKTQSTIKGTSLIAGFEVNEKIKISNISFDTFTQTLFNNVTIAPAVNLTVDDVAFLNGESSSINVDAPIKKALITQSYFANNKGPVVRFGQNTYALQAGYGPVSVMFNCFDGIATRNTASTVGGVLSYAPYSKIIANDIRNVVGGVGDETFGVYTKSRHGIVAFNTIDNVSSVGVTKYAINLKGSERGSTATPQGYGALAIGNIVTGSSTVIGLQMQADQQTVIGNFFDNVLTGIEQGTAVLDDNISIGNRTISAGGVSSRGVTAASITGERIIDALSVHRNVRIGVRYATASTNSFDRLLISGHHLESDAAPGDRGVIVSAGTIGNITNVNVKDITTKNHSRAVDFEGVYGGIIENIRSTGLTTATRPIQLVNCKNIIGNNVWEYDVQTTGNTATSAYQMAISDGNLLTIKAKALARKSGGTSEIYIEREFLFKQEAGVASLVASGTANTLGAGAVGGLDASITSNRPLIRVTGAVAETWDWSVWIDFVLM